MAKPDYKNPLYKPTNNELRSKVVHAVKVSKVSLGLSLFFCAMWFFTGISFWIVPASVSLIMHFYYDFEQKLAKIRMEIRENVDTNNAPKKKRNNKQTTGGRK